MKKSLLDRIEKLAGATGGEPIDIYFHTVDEQGNAGEPEYLMSVKAGGIPCRQITTSSKRITLPL